MQSEAFVFWPSGEREQLTVDPARLNRKGLTNAGNLLTALSINGSIMRGSIATGRAQTLTCMMPSPGLGERNAAHIQAIRIAGNQDAPLAIVVAFRDRNDAAGLEAAIKVIADGAGIGKREIESILGEAGKTPTVVIVTYGAKTDRAVDEAYGLALYLGAAMNGAS